MESPNSKIIVKQDKFLLKQVSNNRTLADCSLTADLTDSPYRVDNSSCGHFGFMSVPELHNKQAVTCFTNFEINFSNKHHLKVNWNQSTAVPATVISELIQYDCSSSNFTST